MNEHKGVKRAVLLSSTPPTPEQEHRFQAFLSKKYGEETTLIWEKNDQFSTGFRLVLDAQVYDWTAKGLVHQLKDALSPLAGKNEDVVPLLKEAVDNWNPRAIAEETGTVLTVGDDIATIDGLEHAVYGEILVFPSGTRGMVQDLKEHQVGCILFGDEDEVSAGDLVRRTGRAAGVPVGEALLGRVVNALGRPIDGRGKISTTEYRPVERPAPSIIDRQSVNRPLETGILAIDSMFPIGRGQRELIIGDRQTGKTAIALDTILNQKGKDVICIYVAIGQKDSSVAKLVNTLRNYGAMDYSVVVNASASDPAPLQYLAPYSGCAMAEYFMEQGKDVLIVYDDLSKHAIAYRTLGLLLGRSPGREAYPGDVFYLHSRLLERATHMSDAKGGGSITALPIVETQGGDVSAYIPTNIISITDGQIFLESGLFFSGQRPAVNIGLSVSRVGGAAQTQAMKSAAGAIRLDLAQYREMEVFTQFSSDLDETTKRQLTYGQGLMQLLRQDQGHPMRQHEQVILLVAALSHTLRDIPVKEIRSFAQSMLAYFEESRADLCARIEHTGKLSAADMDEILTTASKLAETAVNS
jgi:F-type H+-transporting ATPase subunit alpha